MNLQEKLEELLKIEEPNEEQISEIKEVKKEIEEEEIQKKIQSEADKVRGKYSKELKELKEQLESLQNAKLTDEERLEKEKKEKEKLLSEREAQLLKKELDFDTLSLLNDHNLDKSFMSFLTGASMEERQNQIEILEAHINAKIQDTIKSKLGQNPTPSTGNNGGLKVSQEDFKKMSYTDKTNLFLTNPELYNQLKNN